ncbi:Gamma-glutamylputrescine oxidoreductase [Jannaschia seosinensis]|uniref:Gamma-glutamylputrescine oxidoreductase n=1 Tax=Jannaschia seosinensis TaxID=313367 RepID=A0A0M7B8U2_9RHOB|nr:FAD-binding oxidoreductase [Jannaschia seosinensis]CUH18757.1 Gamma-glutamylputrescine oxidoreductase [Jannaschia seosinensis]
MSWLHANGDAGIWPATFYAGRADRPAPFPPLDGDARTELCVIGGGITGLSAALHAAQAGMRVTLLEAQRVGWGASGRNGGQVSPGFNWSPRKLAARLGDDRATALHRLSEEAVRLTRDLADTHAGGARFRPGILSAGFTEAEVAEMAEDAAWADARLGTTRARLTRAEIEAAIGTRAYAGGMLDRTGGRIDPLAYALGLAQACVAAGVTIHEESEVRALDGTAARTERGTVTARFVLHATNGYTPGLTRPTAARVLPINNFIATTAPVPDAGDRTVFAVADSRFVVNYFWWSADGCLVYGGGESYGKRFPSDIRGRVRANLARVYPELAGVELTHAWGGTLAVTASRLPWLSEVAPGVFAAGGYSGHGLALAGLFGKLAVEAMQGARARFDLIAALPVPALPGGRWLGGLAAQAGMIWGSVTDRLRT